MVNMEKNPQDEELYNIFTWRDDKYILWAVVHKDMLSEFGLSDDDLLENDLLELKEVSYKRG